MAGRTSSPAQPPRADDARHTSTLAEVNEFWVSTPYVGYHDAALVVCRQAAQAWLDARGLESDIGVFTEPGRVGVRLSVIIGRSDPLDTARDDHGGVPWRWSARWSHWADKLGRLRRLSGTPISPDLGAGVIDFGARLAMREHQQWSSGPIDQ